MAEFPLQPRKSFFPAQLPGPQIPKGEYLISSASPTEALVPYFPPERIDVLPKSAADFELLLAGNLPLIIADPSNQPKPELVETFFELMHSLGSAQSWMRLYERAGLIRGGKGVNNTDLYVVDRHGQRYLVLDVELDWGGETGYLSLRPVGKKGRGGKVINIDIEDAYGYMVPVLLMRKPFGRRKNPRIRTTPKNLGRDREKTRHCKTCGKATQEGKRYCTDHVKQHEYVVDLIRKLELSDLEELEVRQQGYQAIRPDSIIAKDMIAILKSQGPRSIERLSRELRRDSELVERYVEYLYQQGLVELKETNRGKVAVRFIESKRRYF